MTKEGAAPFLVPVFEIRGPVFRDRVAQAAPRTRFRFRAVTIQDALRLRAQYKARLRALADSLALFDSVGWLGQ